MQDFDAYYPESGVTFGPTICSFGLPYNDHNYALPVGLTPPAMAPHLMDLKYPTMPPHLVDFDLNPPKAPLTNPVIKPIERNTEPAARPGVRLNAKCLIKNKLIKSPGYNPRVVTPPTAITPLVFASIADSTAGLSEPKKALFAAWHAKAAASGGTLIVQQRWKTPETTQPSSPQPSQTIAAKQLVKDSAAFSVPRYCKGLLKVPEGEGGYRCDLDMKVSPLQLRCRKLQNRLQFAR